VGRKRGKRRVFVKRGSCYLCCVWGVNESAASKSFNCVESDPTLMRPQG
jgi:hypothetical protein